MNLNTIFLVLVGLIGCCGAPSTAAWGPLGHAVIGNAALAQVQPATRAGMAQLLGVVPDDELAFAAAVDAVCSWPDAVRETPEWSWSAPQHYVNIPRSSDRYDRQRDCSDGLCITEALPRYVAQLGNSGLDPETRWQALAWVCHLVGDLHQPLHAGFRDDRGGNRVEVEYRGEARNLHQWWDDVLPAERLDWQPGTALPAWVLPTVAQAETGRQAWQPRDVATWTDESHTLARERAYPPGPLIDDSFADSSWDLAKTRWQLAATRLALILDWAWEGPPEPAAN